MLTLSRAGLLAISMSAALVVLGISVGGGTATATSAQQVSTTACQWRIKEDAKGLLLTSAGRTGRIVQVSGDPANPTFAGEFAGKKFAVKLWKGATQGEIDSAVSQMTREWGELAAASVAGATEGDSATEVSETFVGVEVAAERLETVAYRVESGSAVEIGAADSDAEIALADGKIAARGCLRSERAPGQNVELDTAAGAFLMSPTTSGRRIAAVGAYPPSTTAVRYRTFIAPAAVNSGVCGIFAGDNRGFTSFYDKSNRTRASVFFNWPSATMDTTKNVGTTRKLDSSGAVIATKTASAAGIAFDTPSMLPTYGRIHLNHSVGNPLCSVAGPITYSVVIEAWKDGSARIVGTRVKVPNHEAYVYPTSGEWGNTIFTRSSSQFFCLSVNCGQETIWETSP